MNVLVLVFWLLQMIELYRDSSGEVDISSRPGSGAKPAAVLANLSTQDDINKIAELRSTIKSLQMQIEVCKCLLFSCEVKLMWAASWPNG